jgi:hypothetical protein
MKHLVCILIMLCCFPRIGLCARAPVSEATEACLGCHSSIHPGIVEAWQQSRHAMITPRQAMEVKGIGRKVSSASVPEKWMNTGIGCAECHTMRAENHADTFEHNDADVHVAVSPADCAVCHAEEVKQYGGNIMAHARNNLLENPVYQSLEQAVIGRSVLSGGLTYEPPDADTRAEACFFCHGTKLELKGVETRSTAMGEMVFPRIEGWPNQGSGRVNLDGSLGSCGICHTRHGFSIEMARKPYTCGECHVGPDVPAYKVYMASKHGQIYSSMNKKWRFDAVPWVVGRDFETPTCAACHMSLLVNTDGEVVAQRTHQLKERLSWRIFGLIYAHPHPQNPDTTGIRSKDGLSLPTALDGEPAASYLIDPEEQSRRTQTMQAVCLNCHSQAWTGNHWKRFDKCIRETNGEIRTATQIMQTIWNRKFARGPAQGENPFDEAIERTWCDAWLFYANTVRFTSAMAGGGDYGVFADGRYQLAQRIRELNDWLELRNRLFPPAVPVALKPEQEKTETGRP